MRKECNGAGALENSLAAFERHNNSVPQHIPKRTENMFTQKPVYRYSKNSIYNSQKVEITPKFIN